MKDITRRVTRSDASDPESRMRNLRKVLTVGLLAAILGSIITFAVTNHYKNTKDAAVSNSISQAEVATQSDICKTFPEEPLCKLAQQILANPGESVAEPSVIKGEDGRGVAAFRTDTTGDLIVTYTDGNSANLGRVIGRDGAPGKDGKDGKDGENGESVTGEPGTDGAAGVDGASGVDGANGRGIVSTTIADGALVVTYDDGEVVNAGNVVGPAGAKGDKGDPGEPGINGVDGVSVVNVTVDETNTVNVTYSDGRVEAAGTVTVNPTTIAALTCVDGTLTLTLDPYSTASTGVVCDPSEIPQQGPPAILPQQ